MERRRDLRGDTSLGGGDDNFPKTTFHLVRGLQGEGSPESQKRALERLCRRYWKPVYAFVRRAWAKSNEDAKDLAQAFFLWMLETGRLSKYEETRGTFRGYLKLLLRGFLADREDALGALKRGGGLRIVPLQEAPELSASAGLDPEGAFDRHWKLEVIKRALRSVERGYADEDREVYFRVFREVQSGGAGDRPTYAEVGRRLGITESDVRNFLHAVRQRVRDAIRSELADTVTGPAELEDEWAALFGRS
jgi:RNA polymerase sigma-70 factor (ECF subfamily)